MESIKEILMRRDGMTSDEADDMIADAQEDFDERINDGELPYDFCEEWFGLEPDYLIEFMNFYIK